MACDGAISNMHADVYLLLLHPNGKEGMDFLFGSRFVDVIHSTANVLSRRYNFTVTALIEEIQRLLAIKIFLADNDGTKVLPTALSQYTLSPSPPHVYLCQVEQKLTHSLSVELLWRALILDTQFYAELQRALGGTLHHPPDKEIQLTSPCESYKAQNLQRLQTKTLESLYGLFGSQPLRIKNLASQNTQLEGSYKICVRDLQGKAPVFDVVPDLTVAELKEMIFSRQGYLIEWQRLNFGDQQLQDNVTLSSYKICSNSKLNLVLALGGC